MNWAAFSSAEPALAKLVEERFGAFTHHILATLRKDGSPRTTGLEVTFRGGELWLGMMPDSLKALDLRRDPRFALQANPGEGQSMGGGDVRISGRASRSWTRRRRPRTAKRWNRRSRSTSSVPS